MNELRTKASNWYRHSSEFMQVCQDAVSQARGESDETFAHDMIARARNHGLNTFLSDRQLKNLCRIADHVPPVKIAR